MLFCPAYLSKNPTFVPSDLKRVETLTKWNIMKLLRPQVRTVSGRDFAVVDAAFMVLLAEKGEKGVTLICWNGMPIADYRATPTFQRSHVLESLYEIKRRNSALDNYTIADFALLFDTKRLFFIFAPGYQAIKLKPLDIIVACNLLIRPDNLYPGYYSYLLQSGDSFGKALRICQPKSMICMCLICLFYSL